jgi:prepilin-type N-terminal cleavage/methylation domain-containing protein/prepilin-type processing-associated H-X9-DG protein
MKLHVPSGCLGMRRAVRRHQRVFTLVELLVVIAIISILMSILLPSLNKARDTVRRIACLSNLRQLGLAASCYENDFNSWLPMAWQGGVSGGNCGGYWLRYAALGQYAGRNATNTNNPKVFFCQAQTPVDISGTYGWSCMDKLSPSGNLRHHKRSEVKMAATVMLCADGVLSTSDTPQQYYRSFYTSDFPGQYSSGRIGMPHNGLTNSLFFDNHAEGFLWIRLKLNNFYDP